MTTARDYYAILGVTRGATPEEIKAAYRAIALRSHPDKNPGDKRAEDLFKQATEAYNVLSDREQRLKYDRTGRVGFAGGQAGSADFMDDIFSSIFAGARRRGRQRAKGADIDVSLQLDLAEAAFGTEEIIEVSRRERCSSCSGTGARPGSTAGVCHACGGTGRLRMQKGLFAMERECGYCRGTGRVSSHRCASCDGRGEYTRDVDVKVRVPPGSDDGTVVRFRQEGHAGQAGMPAGDLRVTIRVKPHPVLKRQGDDIHTELRISFPQATLGAQVDVDTLSGTVKMRIPAGTQSGAQLRLRNKGVQHLHRSGRGDHLVTVRVETPRHLDEEQRALLERFAELEGEPTYVEKRTVWERVRSLFQT